eukprot:CAMPEP_0194399178 /NCGR_PEP_ID=MMETSP0174-20130528/126515_1 /TAXON_ID=216777 /ORGANISM="Proboscia alata, Strain PI-D3" /LENGTH=754 /DNA_ID=CAMNT_0039195557 /DNA_START=101 /DNA_END=2366 /DNA_ORIENTATION=-
MSCVTLMFLQFNMNPGISISSGPNIEYPLHSPDVLPTNNTSSSVENVTKNLARTTSIDSGSEHSWREKRSDLNSPTKKNPLNLTVWLPITSAADGNSIDELINRERILENISIFLKVPGKLQSESLLHVHASKRYCAISEFSANENGDSLPLCPNIIALKLAKNEEKPFGLPDNILNGPAHLVLYDESGNDHQFRSVSVTHWVPKSNLPVGEGRLGKHIAIPSEKLKLRTCNRNEGFNAMDVLQRISTQCPDRCDEVTVGDNYPSVWDSNEHTCRSTHPQVNPPLRPWAGSCNCESTCFTPETNVLESNWPYINVSQQHEFALEYRILGQFRSDHSLDNATYNKLRRIKKDKVKNRFKKCKQNTPPVSSLTRNYGHQHFSENGACSALAKNAPVHEATTTNLTMTCALHEAGDIHLYFIPNLKLIFCGIPKVGSTEWLKFFRYTWGANDNLKLIFCGIPKVGSTEWLKFFRYTWGANDYPSHPHYKVDRSLFLMKNLPIEKAQEILNDPTYTRAVFLRDPAERLLSAYLDKFKHGAYSKKIKEYDKVHAKDGQSPFMKGNKISFQEFVNTLSHPVVLNSKSCMGKGVIGLHKCTDVHWRSQKKICGLDGMLPLYDFVGDFAKIGNHSKLLLQQLGAWDTWGRNYDRGPPEQGKEKMQCNVPAQKRNESSVDLGPGFNQIPPAVHMSKSKEKFEKYYTPELLSKVRKLYAMDYAIYDEIQKWERDSSSDDHVVPAGYRLASIKKSCDGISSHSNK